MMHHVQFEQLPQPILPDHPHWRSLYDMAWRLAAEHIRQGRGRTYVDVAWDPSRNYQWVWDASFIALYCRYGNGQYPGMEGLDNFYELQRDDGYISMTYDMDSGAEPWPDRINPPLFAWAEWEYYRTTGDGSRLERVIEPIERLMDWIDTHRRTRPHRQRGSRDGSRHGRGESQETFQLYWFEDGGSSGMDDAPRAPRLEEAGSHFDWVDLSSQMALSFACLARMHAALGRADRTAHWKARAQALGELINAELWCERTRFYHDRMIPLNFMGHKTIAGFWPLVAEVATADRVQALVAHLLDERAFNRPTPVPSLAADDANYCPDGTYWLGGVWPCTNYMVARGLGRHGQHAVAHDIACRYLDQMALTAKQVAPATIWECYSPEAPLPGITAYTAQRVKPDFVGWGGLGPIAMLIENILGIDLDVPEKTVRWDIHLTSEHGIANLRVDGAPLKLHCAARKHVSEPARITVESEAPLRLQVHRGDQHAVCQVQAGEPSVWEI